MKELATSGDWRIVVASRSVRRAEKAVSSLRVGRENVEIAPLDLADLSSVRNFAKTWGSQPIDCLALNAGIQCGSGKQPRSTAQDFEETIGVNHLGHFLLVNLLLKNVQKAPKGRVVFTGSGVHNPGTIVDGTVW